MDLARSIIAFKAGRAQRREGTDWVDPSPTKGVISVAPGQEDGLLHLYWVNRENNNVEEVSGHLDCYIYSVAVPIYFDYSTGLDPFSR
jgi:hypothetical protein